MSNDITGFTAVGRLTRDAELKYTSTGTAISSFSIASNYGKKDRSGNWVDEVSYFDFTVFGKRAEGLNQYLVKGQQVIVTGQLRQDRWEDKDNGNKRSKVSFFVDNIELIGGKPQNGGQAYGQAQGGRQQGYGQQYSNQYGGSPPGFTAPQPAGSQSGYQQAPQGYQQGYQQQRPPQPPQQLPNQRVQSGPGPEQFDDDIPF